MKNPAKVLKLDFCDGRCDTEVYVNGIPLRHYNKNEFMSVSVSLLPYVVEGVNTLELVVNVGPTPNRAKENAEVIEHPKREQKTGYAEAKVVCYPDGVYPDDPSGEILASLALDASTAPDAKPRIARTTFEIKKDQEPTLKRWAWVEAPKIDLKKDGEEIQKTVEYVWQCFSKGDFSDRMVALNEIRTSEWYHAYPAKGDPSKSGLKMKKYFHDLTTEPDWGIVPLNPAQFDYRLCADGKLVQILNRDWIPTVRTVVMEGFGSPVEYPMFLAKVKGKFVILR